MQRKKVHLLFWREAAELLMRDPVRPCERPCQWILCLIQLILWYCCVSGWPSAVPAERSEHLSILIFIIISVLFIILLIIITMSYRALKRWVICDKCVKITFHQIWSVLRCCLHLYFYIYMCFSHHSDISYIFIFFSFPYFCKLETRLKNIFI